MKQINKVTSIIITSIGMFGCITIHHGTPTNSVQIEKANFRYVQQNVSGYSSASYILGIGSSRKYAMILNAKNNLLDQFPLQANQALANVIVEFKSKTMLGFLYNTQICTYSADIVQFDNEEEQTKKNASYIKKLDENSEMNEYLSLFIFENSQTKDKYYIHPDFLCNQAFKLISYNDALQLFSEQYKKRSYFLPYFEEYEMLFNTTEKAFNLPEGLYWTNEIKDERVRCFNSKTRTDQWLSIKEKAFILPLSMKNTK